MITPEWGSNAEAAMNEVVTIEIEVAPETAQALTDPRRRQAVGRLVDRMVRPTVDDDPLAAVLAATRRAAREAGLTDADIDAEIAAYRAERRG
jgi:predicted nucleic acid-binding protein